MSAIKKIAGFTAGIACAGVLGVAIAQGQPPNPEVSNPALGAGQQSTHETPMGETGVLAWSGEMMRTATITREPQQAAGAPMPAPEPVAVAPAPVAEPVAQAQPEPAPSTNAMGAGPAPMEEPPQRDARADRG